MSLLEFQEGMKKGRFCKPKHKGFVALLYHTGVRVWEALRATKEQFAIRDGKIYFDVGPRLKGGSHTAPLPIPLTKLYAKEIEWCINHTRAGKRVFPYCRATGWNIVDRVFTYPHFFRLNKITTLLQKKFDIIQVKSWTGHKSLSALDSYAGVVAVEEMGDA